ncbi:thioredoxin family protein [uncultured Polaribacter sp.]|uniref:thioredoxin family protein n=1 Tax=uncultured Polaribacter sp. TaxID=174711 RepID=UPI00261F8DCF|nr:thioredoxin family protein [uncultured Polaribacter sp.]
MKKILLSILTFLFTLSSFIAQDVVIEEPIENISLIWEPSFQEALNKSKKENKPVLIYFTGSDWCSPCKVLDKKLFHTEKFKKIADESLILFMVDVPRNKDLIDEKTRQFNKKLSNKYGQKSFPTMVLVNHKGKMLDIKKGVYMTEYYYPFFEKTIAKY